MFASKAAKCCTLPITAFITTFGRSSVTQVNKQPWTLMRVQKYASQARHTLRRQAEKTKTFKERIMAPAGDGGIP